MLKFLICLLILLFSGDMPTYAAGSSGYRASGHTGSRSGYTGDGNAYHRSGGSHNSGGHRRSHGYRGYHNYQGHRDHHGHGSSYRIWIGPGWLPGWWGSAYPYYRYYPYSYYSYYPAPVVIPGQPQAPEPSQEQESYWYYCQDPPGYYPYVKSCPGGWMKVVPEPVPPESR
jgi:hypothetical protein